MGKCGCDRTGGCEEKFTNKQNNENNQKNKLKTNGSFNFLENLHLFGGSISQNICKDDDHSWYCDLSRTYSSVIMIIGLLILLFIVFNIFRMFITPVTNNLPIKKLRSRKSKK